MEVTGTVGYTIARRIWGSNVIRALLNTYPIPVPEYNYPASARVYSVHIGSKSFVRGISKMGADTDAIMYLYDKDDPREYSVYMRELLRSVAERDNWVKFNDSS